MFSAHSDSSGLTDGEMSHRFRLTVIFQWHHVEFRVRAFLPVPHETDRKQMNPSSPDPSLSFTGGPGRHHQRNPEALTGSEAVLWMTLSYHSKWTEFSLRGQQVIVLQVFILVCRVLLRSVLWYLDLSGVLPAEIKENQWKRNNNPRVSSHDRQLSSAKSQTWSHKSFTQCCS